MYQNFKQTDEFKTSLVYDFTFMSDSTLYFDVWGYDDYENFYSFEAFAIIDGDKLIFDPFEPLNKCKEAQEILKRDERLKKYRIIIQ